MIPKMTADSAFEFPCEIAVKAIGRKDDGFSATILELIGDLADIDPSRMRERESGAGRFLSVTLPVTFTDRAHMERVYRALGEHESVLWTL